MFGIASFAQTPFASLANVFFPATMTEDVGIADNNSQRFAFAYSQTEPIGVAVVENDAGVNYFGSRTEVLTFGDSSIQLSTFLQSLADNVNLADTPAIAAQFAVSKAENSGLTDSSVQYFAALETRSEPISPILDVAVTQSAYNVSLT